MSRIFVHGIGAVSPAGWGVPALRQMLEKRELRTATPLARPGHTDPLSVRAVPHPPASSPLLTHPRLRRASSIAQHTLGAALEALGQGAERSQRGKLSLGIVVTTLTGCVNYSRRFYEEVLNDPAKASPLLFPETVFNAPASHLAAYLAQSGLNYTLPGDDGAFLQGLALAAEWLVQGRVEACVVVGAEEMDWIVADAVRCFRRHSVYAAGAGAIFLRPDGPDCALAELDFVTDSFPFTNRTSRIIAAKKMFAQLSSNRTDARSLTVPAIFTEAYNAETAWRCVAACDALAAGKFTNANIGVLGVNQQAIGARFAAVALDNRFESTRTAMVPSRAADFRSARSDHLRAFSSLREQRLLHRLWPT